MKYAAELPAKLLCCQTKYINHHSEHTDINFNSQIFGSDRLDGLEFVLCYVCTYGVLCMVGVMLAAVHSKSLPICCVPKSARFSASVIPYVGGSHTLSTTCTLFLLSDKCSQSNKKAFKAIRCIYIGESVYVHIFDSDTQIYPRHTYFACVWVCFGLSEHNRCLVPG